MLTANRPERRTASCVALAALRQTSSIGGSSESDETALTVMPRGAPSSTVVITTTPVMKLPITRRNTVASKAGPAPGGVSTADMVFLLVERADTANRWERFAAPTGHLTRRPGLVRASR